MAISSRNILHTDMQCEEFHDDLSNNEKCNLIAKLKGYVEVLEKDIASINSLDKIHSFLRDHELKFGEVYELSLVMPDTRTSVQKELAKMQEEQGGGRWQPS